MVSRGNVTDDMWIDYIKNQAPPEPDDNFNVTCVAAMSAEWRTDPALSRNRSHRLLEPVSKGSVPLRKE